MKKFAKFFLFTIVGLSFLWITYAQYLDESTYVIIWEQKCQGDSIWAALSHGFLILILLMIVLLSIWAVLLWKKLRKTSKWSWLFFVPFLNLYPLCKITIGRIRFYCLILFTCFFVYLERKNSNLCASSYLQKLILPIFIVWILSIWILLVMLMKSIICSRDLDKKSHQEPNME